MDKEFPSINNTPDIPKTIEIKVIELIFSFKKKYRTSENDRIILEVLSVEPSSTTISSNEAKTKAN